MNTYLKTININKLLPVIKQIIRSLPVLLQIVLLSSSTFARPVNRQQAETAAYNFLYNKADVLIKKSFSLELKKVYYNEQSNFPLYYIFDINPIGFVIVTADDNLVPVIGYSFEEKYEENLNPVQNWWLHLQTTHAIKNMKESPEIQALWQSLANKPAIKSTKEVLPLCSTKWNQDTHYNYYCPEDSNGPGNHAYAGCVATAMGQVMKYWNYPSNGEGGYAYQHIWPMYFNNYGVIQANFGATTYNWPNMPAQVNVTNCEEVATLLFHCGVSVKMNYGPDGSGAKTESVPFALKHYFKYDESIGFIERSNIEPAIWNSIIIDQLEKGLPMVYSGSDATEGHAWVVDGYQDSSYFHVNWGWSGANNGYFYFSDLNSGNGDFTAYQQAVINIFPKGLTGVSTSCDKAFTAYPNPASSYIYFSNRPLDAMLKIYDMNAMLVKATEGNNALYIGDLKNGFYIAEFISQNRAYRTRFCIIH
ncbi:MAG: Streptopain precursor [Bacteroidetes bacterium ADurb.Bin408]|nr:MAG: Streptopain precursor [Bacteroidetes bacterium ADurb.Bin408]